MALEFNGFDLLDKAKQQAAKRIQRAAVFFKDVHQGKLAVSNPRPHTTPSKPGEYPRKRTGALQKHVAIEFLDTNSIIANGLKTRIGIPANVVYGMFLELNMDRLGFAETAELTEPLIRAILQEKAA